MRSSLVGNARPLAIAMAAALTLTAAAPPVSAAEPAVRPLAAAAKQRAAGANLAHAVAQDAPSTSSSGGGLFRGTRGVIAAVLFVGALGYTIHSRSNDRVHSQVR